MIITLTISSLTRISKDGKDMYRSLMAIVHRLKTPSTSSQMAHMEPTVVSINMCQGTPWGRINYINDELGISPASRSKVSAAPKKEDNPFSYFDK